MQAVVGASLPGLARLAMGCNLAAFFTGYSAVLAACLISLPSPPPSAPTSVPVHPAAAVPHSGEMTKVGRCLSVNAKNPIRRVVASASVCWLFAMVAWAICTAMNQPKLGLALFGVGFGLLIERAQICFYLRVSRYVDHRTHHDGEGDSCRYGREGRDRHLQLRSARRGTEKHVGGPKCRH